MWIRRHERGKNSRLLKVSLAVWLASSLACGFGSSHEVLDALWENHLQYRSRYIDRFPDWDLYLAAPASPQQWQAVKERLRLDQDWQRLEGVSGGWTFASGEPVPEWWKGADAPSPYWSRRTDQLSWSIKDVDGKVFFVEMKS